MGVKGLLTLLTPYKSKWQTALSDETRQPECRVELVIDGPAFAYHVHRLLEDDFKAHCSTATSTPLTAKDLGHAAIKFLEELEGFGLFAKHIFFDGVLPEYKTQERHRRLKQTFDENASCRHSEVTHICGPPYDGMKLPTTFIVPIVLEALFSSRFAAVTSVVPHEAEKFCASAYFCKRNDVILTSDSDMIILAPLGRIVMFSTITISTASRPRETLRADSYEAAKIMKALSCTDLYSLAWRVTNSNHRGNVLSMAASIKDQKPAFIAFKQTYSLNMTTAQQAQWHRDGEGNSNSKAAILKVLDPRISELIQSVESKLQSLEGDPPIMYLLPLFDDVEKSSAWQASSALRSLSYRIFMSSFARVDIPFVSEVDREATRTIEICIAACSDDEVEDGCDRLLLQLPSDCSSICHYYIYAIETVLSYFQDEATAIPNQEFLRNFLMNPAALRQSKSWPSVWQYLHFRAQVEGVLYSLRILQQISRFVAYTEPPLGVGTLSLSPASINGRGFPIQELAYALGELPPVSELLSYTYGGDSGDRKIIEQFLAKWRGVLPKSSTNRVASVGRTKPSATAASSKMTKVRKGARNASNIFSVLDVNE